MVIADLEQRGRVVQLQLGQQHFVQQAPHLADFLPESLCATGWILSVKSGQLSYLQACIPACMTRCEYQADSQHSFGEEALSLLADFRAEASAKICGTPRRGQALGHYKNHSLEVYEEVTRRFRTTSEIKALCSVKQKQLFSGNITPGFDSTADRFRLCRESFCHEKGFSDAVQLHQVDPSCCGPGKQLAGGDWALIYKVTCIFDNRHVGTARRSRITFKIDWLRLDTALHLHYPNYPTGSRGKAELLRVVQIQHKIQRVLLEVPAVAEAHLNFELDPGTPPVTPSSSMDETDYSEYQSESD